MGVTRSSPAPAAPEQDPVETDRQAAALALVVQDHRRLALRWDALTIAIEAGSGASIVRECIVGLIDCARDHFVNEEWAMRTVGATDYLTHKAEHVRLLRDAADMLKNFDTAFTSDDWAALAVFFRHWLQAHHCRFDDRLFARLCAHTDGVAPAAQVDR